MAIGAQTTPRPLEDFLKNNSSCSLKASFRDLETKLPVCQYYVNDRHLVSGHRALEKNEGYIFEHQHMSHQKKNKTLLSIGSWLFNKDPYVMVYEIIPT